MSSSNRITVITPSYNQGEFIEETLQSVLSQAGDFELEYLVIDGGSTDGTVAILRKYEKLLSESAFPLVCRSIDFRWVSENDNGQADAVNKGLKAATGEIIGWLNSDDIYYPGALASVCRCFLADPAAVLIYGNANWISRESGIIGPYPVEPFDSARLASVCFICQPAAFFRTAAVRQLGGVDTALRTCMDYDLWIRFGLEFDEGIQLITAILAGSRLYDETKTVSLRELVYKESIRTVKKYYGYLPESWIYLYDKEIICGLHLGQDDCRGLSPGQRFRRWWQLAGLLLRFGNLRTLTEAWKIRQAKRQAIVGNSPS